MSRVLAFSFLALLPALASCESHPATQVVVVFHAEAGLRAEAQRVLVRVQAGDGSVVFDEENPVMAAGAGFLARVPLIPADGDASRTFEVYAELLGAAGALGELRVVGSYTRNELREIHAWFDDDCRGMASCGEGRTCDRGICVGACFEASEPGTTLRSSPQCGECGACQGGACAPRPDGDACGCADTDRCVAGECTTSVPVASAAGGFGHTCASTRPGNLYCWGTNRVGQLGTGVNEGSHVPTRVSLGALADGAAGSDHTCWVQYTGDRYCWGWRGAGQTGDGSTASEAVREPQMQPPGEPGWASIAAGWSSNCALSVAGEIYCWGSNMGGGCAVDPALEAVVVSPSLVSDSMRFTAVTVGGFHGCGLRDDGTLWCWGYNTSGELGVGDTEERHVPTRSGCTEDECFDDWIAVAAGSFHTCALRDGGRLYCWGGPLNGQLGIGVVTMPALPFAMEVEGRYRAVAGGQSHTCAIAADDSLYCWGRNDLGQLGLGDLERRDVPTRVTIPGGDRILRLGVGREHTCVIRQDESLWCWGSNDVGQLGLGFDTPAEELPITGPRRVCFPAD